MKEGEHNESQDSPGKRSLRPRKVGNYQAMLEDEVTLKTIKDEEQEKKRMRTSSPGNQDLDENEQAPDDNLMTEFTPEVGLGKRKTRSGLTNKRVIQEQEDDVEELEGIEEDDGEFEEADPVFEEEDEIGARLNDDPESAGDEAYYDEEASEYGIGSRQAAQGARHKLKAKAKESTSTVKAAKGSLKQKRGGGGSAQKATVRSSGAKTQGAKRVNPRRVRAADHDDDY